MLDPHELYEQADELPELDRPVLVVAMTGFVDAAGATRLAAEHLRAASDPRTVVTFDVDQVFDYRARRPLMLFAEDHWELYEAPQIRIEAMRDAAGTPFLLLDGPEPDLQWERFAAAVSELCQRLDVRASVGLNSIPMAVPHTRPLGVTAHASRRELIADHQPWLQRVQVPGSAAHLLEYRLGRAGRDAMGFAVHVPHYLAQTDYPAAARTLLDAVSRATGLSLVTDPLRAAADAVRADVDEQVARSDEVRQVVHALEQQYDAYVAGRGSDLQAPGAGPLPTADELGAELERFLAEHTERGDQPG
ncbi:MAG TPA: PAC2 family protein [Mycobacteriales bacterium]|nr:PAC2 family protein [Mycobacteriales bacterium]